MRASSLLRSFPAAACLVACVLLGLVAHSAAHSKEEHMPNVELIDFAIDEQLQVAVTPSVLAGESSWITVSWTGNVRGAQFDWIAAYSPIPTSPQGYLEVLPVKYINLTDAHGPGVTGNLSMWLLHMRAPWVMAYMRGGFEEPKLVGLSNPITYVTSQANVPMQVHLARTADPTQMRVNWVTTDVGRPVVQFQPASGGPLIRVPGNSSTYSRSDMCGGMAKGLGWREPGIMHTAVMGGLVPDMKYSYSVGDLALDVFSEPVVFFAPPKTGNPEVDFIIFGDLGQAQFDGSIGWEEWKSSDVSNPDQPSSLHTAQSVTRDVLEGVVDPTAVVLLIGDLSYARGRGAMWDQHAYVIRPFAEMVPMMTCLGNHEMGWNYTYFEGTDSGGECGVPTQKRFPMPNPPKKTRSFPRSAAAAGAGSAVSRGFTDSPWYSFSHGSVHFVVVSTEHSFEPGSDQYAYLEAELSAVDRAITPWVLVIGHRPLYVSSTSNGDMSNAALLRQYLEPLLLRHKVDAFFAGHHHSYQRSCAVSNGTCVAAGPTTRHGRRRAAAEGGADPSFGVVHMVTGAAGQWQNVPLAPTPLPWLLFGTYQVHGYTRAFVRGRELTLQYVASADRVVWDSVTIVQQPGKAPTFRRNPSNSYQPDDEAPVQKA